MREEDTFLFSVPADHQRHRRLEVGEGVTPPPHLDLDLDLRRVLFFLFSDSYGLCAPSLHFLRSSKT